MTPWEPLAANLAGRSRYVLRPRLRATIPRTPSPASVKAYEPGSGIALIVGARATKKVSNPPVAFAPLAVRPMCRSLPKIDCNDRLTHQREDEARVAGTGKVFAYAYSCGIGH
jgi:hypothetical protein